VVGRGRWLASRWVYVVFGVEWWAFAVDSMFEELSMPWIDEQCLERRAVRTPSPQPRSRILSAGVSWLDGMREGEEGRNTSGLRVEERDDFCCQLCDEGGHFFTVGLGRPMIFGSGC